MKSTATKNNYMPAEWEKHYATWLSWPKNKETFFNLDSVQRAYVTAIKALVEGEKVFLLVDDEKTKANALSMIGQHENLEVKIIPNMYDNREVISQEVLGELQSQFADYCTKAVVSRSADLNEATKRRTTVWEVNSRGVGAQDIGSLAKELLLS